MFIDVLVPILPESVADATIAAWHKKVGDNVTRDENILDLETDKVVLEVPSPVDGILSEILFQEGAKVESKQLLARIKKNDVASVTQDKNQLPPSPMAIQPINDTTTPAVRRLLAENDLHPGQVIASNKDAKLSKEDVLTFIKTNREKSKETIAKEKVLSPQPQANTTSPALIHGSRLTRRVPMSRLRAKVAERLVQAQHDAAMLTTFNEVNLKSVMDLRLQYKDSFEKKHGVKLGFMSFFTQAVVEALKDFPAVNASIDEQDIIYHDYYDIGIAVSTERGLVVPVLRDVDKMSMAVIERTIHDAATRARSGKLSLEEMQGGTFTITNGGVFGSLLATPIINPPQVAILGMHKIEDRPIAEKGAVVIRPMMYLALSYDHRIIDGRESVQYLVRIKELLEDPSRLLLNV